MSDIPDNSLGHLGMGCGMPGCNSRMCMHFLDLDAVCGAEVPAAEDTPVPDALDALIVQGLEVPAAKHTHVQGLDALDAPDQAHDPPNNQATETAAGQALDALDALIVQGLKVPVPAQDPFTIQAEDPPNNQATAAPEVILGPDVDNIKTLKESILFIDQNVLGSEFKCGPCINDTKKTKRVGLCTHFCIHKHLKVRCTICTGGSGFCPHKKPPTHCKVCKATKKNKKMPKKKKVRTSK